MNPLDLYLQRVAHELRAMSPQTRDEELRELRSHLEQRAEDFQSRGLAAEAAQARAVQEFGEPQTLGSVLCDAWEGVRFSWWRVGATCCVVSLIWLVVNVVMALVMSILGGQASTALFPELFPVMMAFYLSVPFGCGWLFSHWLGRRGRLIGVTFFVFLFCIVDFNLKFSAPAQSVGFAPPRFFVDYLNWTWTPLFTAALGFMGAAACHAFRMRARYRLAAVGDVNVSLRPTRVLWVPLNPRTWGRGLLLAVALVALVYARFQVAFHPATASATFRYSLISNGGPTGFEAPVFEEVRELAPTTVAEYSGRERRIRFQVVARAKPHFAASQIAHLKRQIASQAKSKYGVNASTRAALARVQSNRQSVEGTVRMVRTPQGWKMDEKSFDRSQLWSWFYER